MTNPPEKATGRTLAGRCLCGAIHYAVKDEFVYALNCHCSNCRRATGSAFKPFAGIERDKLGIAKGADNLLIFGNASDGDVRCNACGSLLYSVVRGGAFVHVTLGTLVDEPAIRPAAHIFVGSKARWFAITDHLPQYDEHAGAARAAGGESGRETNPATIHLVFGPQGAGKSTYSLELAQRIGGIRFSIDDWMGELYGPDLPKPLNVAWIMERVARCERRIWTTASAVARGGGSVVLDLGFMKVRNRSEFVALAAANQHPVQLHVVTAPRDVRRSRVINRNAGKGRTFSFEVTPSMFDYMEKEFEPPTEPELATAIVFDSK